MTPGPNPVLFVGDLYPSRIYKVSLEGKVLGVYGQPGRNLGEFGWIHAHRVPVGERDLGRRADQLARAEARDQEGRDQPLTLGTSGAPSGAPPSLRRCPGADCRGGHAGYGWPAARKSSSADCSTMFFSRAG